MIMTKDIPNPYNRNCNTTPVILLEIKEIPLTAKNTGNVQPNETKPYPKPQRK